MSPSKACAPERETEEETDQDRGERTDGTLARVA